MKNILLVLFYAVSVVSYAQDNLVANPSFEEYTSLPTNFSNGGKSFCASWYIPDHGSPDYYNDNCNPSYLNKAKEIMNFKDSHTGSACIGFFPILWNGYIEHITGKLNSSLREEEIYRVSFWIKYAGDVCQFSTDCIGVLFTKEKFFLYPLDPFYESIYNEKISASIESKEGLFLKNDSTWIEISLLYKAVGGEKYITLGKFYKEKIKIEFINYYRKADVQFTSKKDQFIRKKKHQNILLLNEDYIEENEGAATHAYYFIDDVNVTIVDGGT